MNYRVETSSRGPRTLGWDNAPEVGSTKRKAEREQRHKLMFWRGLAIIEGYALINFAITLAIISFVG